MIDRSRRAAPRKAPRASANRVDPIPILLVRHGPVSMRLLGALQDDHRFELFVVDELTSEWIPFAQRVAAVLVATAHAPLAGMLYVLTAGVTAPIVVAVPARFSKQCDDAKSAGAIACIVMPIKRADIDRLVRTLIVRAGTTRVDSTLRLLLDPIGRVVRYRHKSVRLSQREFAVLHCLSSRSGRPVAADELLRYVWSEVPGHDQSRRILDVYVFHLRKKLERLGLKGAIATVRGFGYALVHVTRDARWARRAAGRMDNS